MTNSNKVAKLPNNQIVRIDESGRASFTMTFDLAGLVNYAAECAFVGPGDFLREVLSRRATGSSTLLQNIMYDVIGNNGNAVILRVSGRLEKGAAGVTILEEVDLPLREFDVVVTRVAVGSRSLRLSARTQEEAERLAHDDAGNHIYDTQNADYQVEIHPLQ